MWGFVQCYPSSSRAVGQKTIWAENMASRREKRPSSPRESPLGSHSPNEQHILSHSMAARRSAEDEASLIPVHASGFASRRARPPPRSPAAELQQREVCI